MIVNRDAKLIYLAQPRTASRATSDALVSQAGFEWVGCLHDLPNKLFDLDGYTVLATHRNPFDLLVSFWCFRYRPVDFGRGFLEWMWKRYHRYFSDRSTLFGHTRPFVTDWLRYGSFQDDLNAILTDRGVREVEVPWFVEDDYSRGMARYQLFYSKPFRLVVEEQFARDFAEFGYTWEDR